MSVLMNSPTNAPDLLSNWLVRRGYALKLDNHARWASQPLKDQLRCQIVHTVVIIWCM